MNEGGTQMDTTARQSPCAEKTPKRRCLHLSRFVKTLARCRRPYFFRFFSSNCHRLTAAADK